MRRFIALAVLTSSFVVTLVFALVGRTIWRRRRGSTGRILVTGRFDNLNWFLSHATPLSRSGVGEVIVVSESPQGGVPRVRFSCPPPLVLRVLGRALGKLLWMVAVAVRYRPDVVMGYHLFPGALTALIVGRLIGRPACYQMTGGPIEIIGGGYQNENKLMKSLSRPSALVERLAVAVVREFEMVVVRGSGAKGALVDRGIGDAVEIITGSIDTPAMTQGAKRCWDMVFIGRLTEIKQPEQFVSIVAAVARDLPDVRAICVGEGPELPAIRSRAESLGVAGNIEFAGQSDDVPGVLKRSKVFVLTSRSEGLSIAMVEAMGHGLPVVVADVGDLGDVVEAGVNGWVIPPNDIDAYARRVLELLTDEAMWLRSSRAACETAGAFTADRVAERWRDCFEGLVHNGAGFWGRIPDGRQCET